MRFAATRGVQNPDIGNRFTAGSTKTKADSVSSIRQRRGSDADRSALHGDRNATKQPFSRRFNNWEKFAPLRLAAPRREARLPPRHQPHLSLTSAQPTTAPATSGSALAAGTFPLIIHHSLLITTFPPVIPKGVERPRNLVCGHLPLVSTGHSRRCGNPTTYFPATTHYPLSTLSREPNASTKVNSFPLAGDATSRIEQGYQNTFGVSVRPSFGVEPTNRARV